MFEKAEQMCNALLLSGFPFISFILLQNNEFSSEFENVKDCCPSPVPYKNFFILEYAQVFFLYILLRVLLTYILCQVCIQKQTGHFIAI